MALFGVSKFGFSKKKKPAQQAGANANEKSSGEAQRGAQMNLESDRAGAQTSAVANEKAAGTSAEAQENADSAVSAHNAPIIPVEAGTIGETGPFDGDTVDINEFDFGDFSSGLLDLGSLKLAVPKDSQVQVEMGEKGPKMLHLVTHYGRLTPIAFAAPSSAGQWEEAADEIAQSMKQSGAEVTFEQGPWGREVVGENKQAVTRVIGAEQPRWMLRVTLAGPAHRADKLAELAREVIARTFVYRGDKPILAGNSLPVTMPASLMQQVQQAMQQRQAQSQQQSPRIADAQQAVREAAGGTKSREHGDDEGVVQPTNEKEQR